MKKVMHRLFWAWSYDKEENWLNAMAEKGLTLTDVGVCRYVFEEGQGSYIYRLELLENALQHPESQAYIRFVEETGAEYVGAVKRWVYFRRPAALGPFELYSDNESRLRYMERILRLLLPLFICNLFNMFNNMALYMNNGHAISLACAMLSLLIAIFLARGTWRVWSFTRNLKKNSGIYD